VLDFDEVVGIEFIPFDGNVFNLTVEDDNTYVLNEIVTHNCLCGRRSVQMGQDEFVDKLRGWMNGTGEWAGMDGYMDWTGISNMTADRVEMAASHLSIGGGAAGSLLTWLWGDEAALGAAVKRDVQLDLW
jgi:hypothetical protein